MIIKDFWFFLVSNSSETPRVSNRLKDSIIIIVQALCFIYIFKLLWTAALVYLVKHQMLSPVSENGGLHAVLLASGPIGFIAEYVVLAPLLEEFGFRAILQKKPRLTAAGASTILLLLLILLFKIQIYSLSYPVFIAVGMAAVTFGLLIRSPGLLLRLVSLRDRYATAVLWLSALAFAFWHFHHVDFTNSSVYTVAWYLMPHFIVGLLFSYVSLRFGFFTGCVLHVCNNLFPAIFLLYANSADLI